MHIFVTKLEATSVVTQLIIEYWNKFKLNLEKQGLKHLHNKLKTRPIIKWKPMEYYIAGQVDYYANEIMLNLNFLYSEDANQFLHETTLHELAHIIAIRLYNNRTHENEFNDICNFFNISNKEFHLYKIPTNMPGLTIYVCENCKHKYVISKTNLKTFKCKHCN